MPDSDFVRIDTLRFSNTAGREVGFDTLGV
jgi:hypothetical protein